MVPSKAGPLCWTAATILFKVLNVGHDDVAAKNDNEVFDPVSGLRTFFILGGKQDIPRRRIFYRSISDLEGGKMSGSGFKLAPPGLI
jgi:hypothetical protein